MEAISRQVNNSDNWTKTSHLLSHQNKYSNWRQSKLTFPYELIWITLNSPLVSSKLNMYYSLTFDPCSSKRWRWCSPDAHSWPPPGPKLQNFGPSKKCSTWDSRGTQRISIMVLSGRVHESQVLGQFHYLNTCHLSTWSTGMLKKYPPHFGAFRKKLSKTRHWPAAAERDNLGMAPTKATGLTVFK